MEGKPSQPSRRMLKSRCFAGMSTGLAATSIARASVYVIIIMLSAGGEAHRRGLAVRQTMPIARHIAKTSRRDASAHGPQLPCRHIINLPLSMLRGSLAKALSVHAQRLPEALEPLLPPRQRANLDPTIAEIFA